MIFDSLEIETLLAPNALLSAPIIESLAQLGFENPVLARQRFSTLCETDAQRACCARLMPALLHALSEAATPDGSLLNFQRFLQCVPDQNSVLEMLSQRPRAVEILVKLFVGSQFLTELLLRNPQYLDQLTNHKRLADFKSRQGFIQQGGQEISTAASLPEVMDGLRRYQQWELLRLAACDTFGLMDLKTVTLQLALLADGLVQLALEHVACMEGCALDGFTILAFGKLGGEELNYSSDIDLVLTAASDAERYWTLGQKLIRVLDEATSLGFLYRVDLRLRPWGNSGALVATADAYVEYLQKQGQLWEKQALIKARPIAGDLEFGASLRTRLEPFIYQVQPAAARQNILEMKQKIETQLKRRGRLWGDVKSSPGGIRDIEFVTQYLQLIYGGDLPAVRSTNTLDALIRLSEHDLIFPEEYRRLTTGYLFLRTVEHTLQLMHNQQEHHLPTSQRGLAYLAGRLDFPDAETFVQQYELHAHSVREIFNRYLHDETHPGWPSTTQASISPPADERKEKAEAVNTPAAVTQLHRRLMKELGPQRLVRVHAALHDQYQRVIIAGFEGLGELPAICGLMFSYGFDILSGITRAGVKVKNSGSSRHAVPEQSSFIIEFLVRPTAQVATSAADPEIWSRFERELNELLLFSEESGVRAMQGRLARRVASGLESTLPAKTWLMPVDIELEETSAADTTVLRIRSDDVPGFLYELTNAIAVSGLSIRQMSVETVGRQACDTLTVVDEKQHRLACPERLHELRATIVLIKHFTHLLPHSPNPESALLHFQEFLEHLFQQPHWLDEFGSLQDSQVLSALATLLGNSDFLWDDFLRLQHENLFPVVTNVAGLQQAKDRDALHQELQQLLTGEADPTKRIAVLNAFKDREMMRVDMRHILGLQDKFGMFGRELTDVAEVIVAAAVALCDAELQAIHGIPQRSDGTPVAWCVCALGKFGGCELGYASDIELMFLYEEEGETAGPQRLPNADFFQRLVQHFQQVIHSRRQGVFAVDLRLRPFGHAGSLAVSRGAFESYFEPHGPAWPYERQALVKLRPVAGSHDFGRQMVQLRDTLIYRQEPFDDRPLRAMREKQVRQLVRAGTFNAKLSPGGLVDCEYLVQALQITFGHLSAAIREPNTREAMKALEVYGILTGERRVQLRDAYRFWRRVIDALRVVRGDASNLTIPPVESDEFVFLTRRMGDGITPAQLRIDLETHARNVMTITATLPNLIQAQPVIPPV